MYIGHETARTRGNHFLWIICCTLQEKSPKICIADPITEKEFGFIKDKYGGFHYKNVVHHNNVNEDDDAFISGGRKEVKIGGKPNNEFYIFKVEDGSFIEVEHKGEIKYEDT